MQQPIKLLTGDTLPYLGEKKVLVIVREERQRAKVKCVMERCFLFVPYDADYAYRKTALEKWYRKEAAAIIREKAEDYGKSLGVTFEHIHIKDQKSCWGSCSSKRNLNFNWRLLMAPEPVLDYVVIHELCHLKHMNHSKHFWGQVENICPAYKQYRQWLKENGASLYLF